MASLLLALCHHGMLQTCAIVTPCHTSLLNGEYHQPWPASFHRGLVEWWRITELENYKDTWSLRDHRVLQDKAGSTKIEKNRISGWEPLLICYACRFTNKHPDSNPYHHLHHIKAWHLMPQQTNIHKVYDGRIDRLPCAGTACSSMEARPWQGSGRQMTHWGAMAHGHGT